MKNDVLILGARPYDFTDENTGKQISGITLWVLPLTNEDPSNQVGLLPVKYSLTSEQFSVIAGASFPAVAEMHMQLNIATKRIKFDHFENIQPVDLEKAA
ncbi:hypothetical protein [Streptococcus thermophilus]|uniref:hypothetical protein n=1 Tax=Streptococcus thermophilus TaxID=1308 RepID=UPI0003F01629|nr:hypothetical protein [Streptococcus thermophilus]EWM60205.1 hypothetical protein Y022_10315 [Streptococcus thermophilus TH1477]MCE2245674.1 hypothetical protein [Streptococcus thermophilus]